LERSGRGLTAVLFRHLHRGSEEDDEFRNGYLPITSAEHYRYTSLVCRLRSGIMFFFCFGGKLLRAVFRKKLEHTPKL